MTHFKVKDTHSLKVKGWKKILHANGNNKKAGLAILILDKKTLNNVHKERQRRAPYGKGINTRRGHCTH